MLKREGKGFLFKNSVRGIPFWEVFEFGSITTRNKICRASTILRLLKAFSNLSWDVTGLIAGEKSDSSESQPSWKMGRVWGSTKILILWNLDSALRNGFFFATYWLTEFASLWFWILPIHEKGSPGTQWTMKWKSLVLDQIEQRYFWNLIRPYLIKGEMWTSRLDCSPRPVLRLHWRKVLQFSTNFAIRWYLCDEASKKCYIYRRGLS